MDKVTRAAHVLRHNAAPKSEPVTVHRICGGTRRIAVAPFEVVLWRSRAHAANGVLGCRSSAGWRVSTCRNGLPVSVWCGGGADSAADGVEDCQSLADEACRDLAEPVGAVEDGDVGLREALRRFAHDLG
jgi:hypothetical protein